MPPIQLTPQFGGQPAPFGAQPQSQGADPRLLLGLGGLAQGFLQGGQQGGLGAALLGGAAGALPGFARGQLIQQEQAQQQAATEAAARQQQIENQRARVEAQRKAAADARGIVEFDRRFGLDEEKEQRLIGSAQSAQDIARQNVELGRGNLDVSRQNVGLRQREFERGPVDPLVEIFDATSPTGSRFAPRSEAAGAPSVGSFAGSGLTPKSAEELGAQANTLTSGLSRLDSIIADLEANPQRAGAVGAINKFLQTGLGVGREVIDLVPGASSVADALIGPAITEESDEVQSFLGDQSIEKNQTAANSLAYIIAQGRKPGQRVTVKDIELAFEDMQLTGLKSTKQKIAQLREIRNELQTGVGLIQSRVAQGAPGGQTIASQPSGGQVIEFDAQGNIVQ